MKIYISADMEGATGVVNSVQTMHNESEYAFGCKMQLHDVKAVVEGALEAGAKEILVNDSHGRMINLDIEGFGSGVRLLSGTPKQLCMVEGHGGADAAFFVGYHAKAGTANAILDHTISGLAVYSVVLNGTEVGETGLNAAACAGQKVPLALVTGDAAVCAESRALLGESLVTACVKKGHGRMAADCLSPTDSAKVLREAASLAVERARQKKAPLMGIGDGSFDLRVTFHNSMQCDWASTIPGTQRIDGRTVKVCGPDMSTMMRWALSLIFLGGR